MRYSYKAILISIIIISGFSIRTCQAHGVDIIKSSWQQYPIITSLAVLTALYAVSYGLVQFCKKNKPAGLIEYTTQGSQENYIFAHGIAETHEQAYWYTKGTTELPYLIDGRLFTYDFPDATKRFWRVNFTQTALGQQHEIMGFKSAYEQVVAKLNQESDSNKDLVLMGMSRGATTILNFMGLYKPKNIKAVIVESPFDATKTLSTNMLSKIYLDRLPGMQLLGHYLMSAIFWQHSVNGERAIDIIHAIDKELPILLVCSKADKTVPAESTVTLYKALKDSGHKNVHLFVADHGRHGRILHGADGKRYQQVVHAFYKRYGLHHDPALAEAGQILLK